jgi:hypothetical protein
MRKRSLAIVAAIALLGGAAQGDARGGGIVIGGAFHGGARHGMTPPASSFAPASTFAPPHQGPLYASPPPERHDDQVQHDFRRDGDFRQDGDFRRGRDRFGSPGIGFSGGDTGFVSVPSRRAIPVLYNYYYGASDNYYSNVPSDYGAPATPCPDEHQDDCRN